MKAEASVAGRLQTPPYAAKRKGLISEAYAALRSDGNRSIVVIGNCACGPITVEPCRAKTNPLRPRRSYFAPTSNRGVRFQVEAPGTAPGSEWFIAAVIYRHSRREAAIANIGHRSPDLKPPTGSGNWRETELRLTVELNGPRFLPYP